MLAGNLLEARVGYPALHLCRSDRESLGLVQPSEAAAQNDDAAAQTEEPDVEAPADEEKKSVDNIIPLDTFRKE